MTKNFSRRSEELTIVGEKSYNEMTAGERAKLLEEIAEADKRILARQK